MGNSLLEITKQAIKNNRKLVVSMFTVTILLSAIGITVYLDQIERKAFEEYNANLSKAQEAFNRDDFSVATEYYRLAYKHNNDKAIQDKINLCKRLENSADNYKWGLYFQKLGDYTGYLAAYKDFKRVVPEDTKRYKSAQEAISNLATKLVSEDIRLAEIAYSEKEYYGALSHIEHALEIDKENKRLIELREIYFKAHQGQMEQIVAQWEVEHRGKQQEEQKLYGPQKIVDRDGKQIWKIYIKGGCFHFKGNYKGSGNFIVKLLNSNQELISVIANEIGDYVADKSVKVPNEGWYYLEIYCTDGATSYSWE